MSLLISMMENLLGLSDAEKAQVEQALPYLKQIVDALNKHIDDLWFLNGRLVWSQSTIGRLVDDYRTLGPQLSILLADGWVDIGAAVTAAQDMQAAVKENSAIPAILATYNKMIPDLNVVIRCWPHAQPALTIIMAAMQRRNLTMAHVQQFVSQT